MFLPDAFKPDVQKFFASPAGQALLLAMSQRRPAVSDGTTPMAHTLLNSYAIREGYDLCIGDLKKVQFDSAEPPAASGQEAVLTDPRD